MEKELLTSRWTRSLAKHACTPMAVAAGDRSDAARLARAAEAAPTSVNSPGVVRVSSVTASQGAASSGARPTHESSRPYAL